MGLYNTQMQNLRLVFAQIRCAYANGVLSLRGAGSFSNNLGRSYADIRVWSFRADRTHPARIGRDSNATQTPTARERARLFVPPGRAQL